MFEGEPVFSKSDSQEYQTFLGIGSLQKSRFFHPVEFQGCFCGVKYHKSGRQNCFAMTNCLAFLIYAQLPKKSALTQGF